MSAFLAVLALLAVAVLAGACRVYFLRAREARAEIDARVHRLAYGLDIRCDFLQRELDKVTRHQRIDHILDLVAEGRAAGQLPAPVAVELRRYALDLREEAFRLDLDLPPLPPHPGGP